VSDDIKAAMLLVALVVVVSLAVAGVVKWIANRPSE
jgi:hypothetical protein